VNRREPTRSEASFAPASIDGGRLCALLRAYELDAALDAGLMDFIDDPVLDPADRALILAAQRQLRAAWDARERYRARQARLARRDAARPARRNATAALPASQPALPPAAAAALARAKARARPT
jgi:hypothetical protein